MQIKYGIANSINMYLRLKFNQLFNIPSIYLIHQNKYEVRIMIGVNLYANNF